MSTSADKPANDKPVKAAPAPSAAPSPEALAKAKKKLVIKGGVSGGKLAW